MTTPMTWKKSALSILMGPKDLEEVRAKDREKVGPADRGRGRRSKKSTFLSSYLYLSYLIIRGSMGFCISDNLCFEWFRFELGVFLHHAQI